MPPCPSCQQEQPEGSERCGACGAPMGAAAPAAAGADETWESVATLSSPEQAAIVQGLLESAEIPCEVLDRSLSELPVPASTDFSTLAVMVPASRAAEALALLESPIEGTVRCPTCGHLGASEDAGCEYCGPATA